MVADYVAELRARGGGRARGRRTSARRGGGQPRLPARLAFHMAHEPSCSATCASGCTLHQPRRASRCCAGRDGCVAAGYAAPPPTCVEPRAHELTGSNAGVFSDPRDALPLHLHDLRRATCRSAPGSSQALGELLRSRSGSRPCTISRRAPVPYWDGGITDYHLHLDYASRTAMAMPRGPRVFHPQCPTIPAAGQGLRHRHRATARLGQRESSSSPSAEGSRRCRTASCPTAATSKHFGDDLRRGWRRGRAVVRGRAAARRVRGLGRGRNAAAPAAARLNARAGLQSRLNRRTNNKSEKGQPGYDTANFTRFLEVC